MPQEHVTSLATSMAIPSPLALLDLLLPRKNTERVPPQQQPVEPEPQEAPMPLLDTFCTSLDGRSIGSRAPPINHKAHWDLCRIAQSMGLQGEEVEAEDPMINILAPEGADQGCVASA